MQSVVMAKQQMHKGLRTPNVTDSGCYPNKHPCSWNQSVLYACRVKACKTKQQTLWIKGFAMDILLVILNPRVRDWPGLESKQLKWWVLCNSSHVLGTQWPGYYCCEYSLSSTIEHGHRTPWVGKKRNWRGFCQSSLPAGSASLGLGWKKKERKANK